MVLAAHALEAVQNGVKSVINEGHVSLDAEIVLRPYLFWH
jgi:hypothetical protein